MALPPLSPLTISSTAPPAQPASTPLAFPATSKRFVMGLFRKKPQPLWFVLKPAASHSLDRQPLREGPYTRASIVRLYAEQQLPPDALLWTNERIFPNADRPNSSRLVRLMEWRRMDQLPDPVVRQIQAEALALNHPPSPQPQQPLASPHQSTDSTSSTHSDVPSSPPPPPPPPPNASIPANHHPTEATPQYVPPSATSQPHTPQQPAVYPHQPPPMGAPQSAPYAHQSDPNPYPQRDPSYAPPPPAYAQQPAVYPHQSNPPAPHGYPSYGPLGAPPPPLH